VTRDPVGHLGIERFGGCDIDRLAGKGTRAGFCSHALSRSRPARDEDDGHGRSDSPCALIINSRQ